LSARTSFPAIVLAGSRGGRDPVAEAAGVSAKCLAPVGGIPMVLRVVATLAACSAVEKILLVADDHPALASLEPLAQLAAEGRLLLLQPAASPSLSVRAARAEVGDRPVLVTTADHALLDQAMLRYFLDDAARSSADVTVGLVAASVILAAYPDSVRTFWRFRDERFSGANLFALLTPAADKALFFWRRVERERKRPWRIARIFGWRHLIAYLLGRVSLADAMRRASRVTGCRIEAVAIPIAEAAIDVDKPADLDLANRILAARAA
jgi:GTP:adenosylcobinamide-phosphate guanylyltransferase